MLDQATIKKGAKIKVGENDAKNLCSEMVDLGRHVEYEASRAFSINFQV
jgi:hypothetical protein